MKGSQEEESCLRVAWLTEEEKGSNAIQCAESGLDVWVRACVSQDEAIGRSRRERLCRREEEHWRVWRNVRWR